MARGGMLLTVEVNSHPAPDHLHLLTPHVVRAWRRMQSGDHRP